MNKRKPGPRSITRVDAGGCLTIPAEYRRALSLSGDAAVALIPLGDALVIAPCDDAFCAVIQRLEARMHAVGVDVEELIAEAAEARAQIVREEFVHDGEE
jgi:bifunctional DNA-binding transcriptional regulator/antitoxin component of YhaV-PrlF toxin-antitoxin module